MSILARLLACKLKNQLKSFIRSPGKMIITVVMIGLFALVIWSGGIRADDIGVTRDRAELQAIITGLYIAMFIMITSFGMARGATFFSMPDVNLLFPAPVSPIKILLYGLTQQLGTSLVTGVFLMYQYSYLHGAYGITVGELFVYLLGYSLTILCANVTAMTVYAATSASDSRRRNAKIVLIGAAVLILLPTIIIIVRGIISGAEILPTLISASQTVTLALFPFSGWLAWAMNSFVAGNAIGILGVLGAAAGAAALVVWLTRAQPDYYEDVLQATGTAHEQKQASREGKFTTNTPSKKIVKLRKRDGSLRGEGASAFAYKQRLEENRGRVLLLSPMSWITLVVMVVMSLFMRRMPDDGFIAVLATGVYMQMIFSAFDRWGRELLMHYIYLVPEPPFRKLLWCLAQNFRKELYESIITWLACGFILRMSPPMILLMMALRMVFSLLLVSTNLLIERLLSHLIPKWAQLTVYFLLVIVLLAPGITLGIILMMNGVVIVSELGTLFLTLAVVEIPIGLGVLFGCRNVLEYSEVNQGAA